MNHPTRTARSTPETHAPAEATLPPHTPAGLVGDTPVLWIGAPFTAAGRGFWAKLEGHNPGGEAGSGPVPASSSRPRAPSASAWPWPWPVRRTAIRSPSSPTPASSR